MVGLLPGVLVWFFLRPVVARWVGGHSRSHTYYASTVVFSAISLPLFSWALFFVLNGALDFTPPARVFGKVTSVRHFQDDDDHPKTEVVIRWEDGSEGDEQLSDPGYAMRVGDRATYVRKRGALGVRWIVEDPKVLPPNVPYGERRGE